MYGKKKLTRNLTKLLAVLLAVVCVIQTVEPVNVKADSGTTTTSNIDGCLEEGEDYTIDADGCVTLLPSGIELLENGEDGNYSTQFRGWDYNACMNMKSINLPDGMTRIADEAFNGCWFLESITIPDSVTYIGGSHTFADCKSLKSITIPESVEGMVIDKTTFRGCESLKNVTISGKGTTIGASAFYFSYTCDNTLSSVVINDPDVTIEAKAFGYATIKKISLPEGMTEIPDYALWGCDATSVNIPSTVTRIGDWAFAYNETLKSITIPKNVTYIGEGAFCDCIKMTSVTFKKNTSTSKKLTISTYAFEYCKKLTSITIPRNIKTLSTKAFRVYCSVKKVTIKGNVDKIKDDAFQNMNSLTTIVITGNVGKTGWIIGDIENKEITKVKIGGTLGSGLKKICYVDKVIVNGKTYRWKWVTPETIDQYEWTSQTSVYEYGEYMLVQVK